MKKEKQEKILKIIQDYAEWTLKQKTEALERNNVMIAYDMDSRWVAAKQILESINLIK